MSAPYVCSRCLRASRQIAQRSNTLPTRSYSIASTSAPRAERSRIATPRQASQLARPQTRWLSSSSRLHKPSLEQTSAAKTRPPPPETSAQSSQASLTPNASAKAQYITHTVLNPRFDEESGEEMKIALTPRATKRLQQIMTKDSNPSLCLRVTVESGGCHGFQYLMSLVDMSKIDENEDVVFVGSTPENAVPSIDEGSGSAWREVAEGRPKVVIDESSLELLRGSNVDYTMELIGSQFKIDNPRASSSCGCGTSFDVKI